jgi:hypothetical protein
LTESAEFPDLVESMKPAMAGPLHILHAEVKTDPTTALEAPVTEVTIVDIKEGTFEDIKPLGEAIDANAHLLKGTHIPSSWGRSIQDCQKIGVAVGWDSVEVSSIGSLLSWQSILNHLAVQAHAAMPGIPPFSQIFAKMSELADLTTCHVKFKKLVI